MCLVVATLGLSGGFAACRIHSGGFGVMLPSAKRSRLFPDGFDDCSSAGVKLSPRDEAIIREMNVTVFAIRCPGDWRHWLF